MSNQKHKLSFVIDMIDKITSPIQRVTNTTTRSGEKIKSLQTELIKLKETSKDIDSFKKLGHNSMNLSREMASARALTNKLAEEIKSSEKPTRQLKSSYLKAESALKKLEDRQIQGAEKLQTLRQKLRDAGVSTGRLSESVRKLKSETEHYNKQLKEEKLRLEDIADREKKISGIKKHLATDTVSVTAATYSIKKLVDAYGAIHSAQSAVKSLGLEDVQVVTNVARDYSNTWSGTSQEEFIKASYAIKSGISTLSDASIAEYTRLAALTATATDSTVGEMTRLFAAGYGIFNQQFQKFGANAIAGWEQLTQAEKDASFGMYFSDGLAAAVKQFRSSGKEMQGAISSLGASGVSANVSYAEQLAVLGQLQSVWSGSESGTKYKAFLNSAASAGEKLGLNFLDANDQLRSTPEILSEIQYAYGHTLSALDKIELKKAFGSDEAMAFISKMYPEISELSANINGMGQALRSSGQNVVKMAADVTDNASHAMRLLNQRIVNLTATLGELFAPVLVSVSNGIGLIAVGLANFIEKFPTLSNSIACVISGLVAFKVTLIAARLANLVFSSSLLMNTRILSLFNGAQMRQHTLLLLGKVRTLAVSSALLTLTAVQKSYAAGTALMTGAQWAWNAALTASPIGIAITGISAVVALASFFIKDWGRVGTFFQNIWQRIKNIIQSVYSSIGSLWESITDKFQHASEWIQRLLSPIQTIKNLLNASWSGSLEKIKATSINPEIVHQLPEKSPAVQHEIAADNQHPALSVQRTSSQETVLVQPRTEQNNRYEFGNIIVETHPGMDARAVAKEVEKQLDAYKRKAERNRRTLAIDT